MGVFLIILGAPLWIPVLLSVFAIIFSLYAALWSVTVSLWASFTAILVSAPASLVLGVLNIHVGNEALGYAMIGGALVLAGISIFAFYGCKYATRGLAILTKNTVIGIKNIIIR